MVNMIQNIDHNIEDLTVSESDLESIINTVYKSLNNRAGTVNS